MSDYLVSGIDYVPNPRQALFHSLDVDEALYGGAAGGGKSYALLAEAVFACLEAPNNRAILMRRTYPELEGSLIDVSLRFIPERLATYRADSREWDFKNGSKLYFRHAEKESDVLKYKSAEFGYVGIDELTSFTEFMYLFMFSRCRSAVRGVKPRIRAGSNPGDIGHQWVKKRFIDVAPPGEVYRDPETGLTRCFIPARVWDNVHLLANDPNYVRRLKSLPGKLSEAYLEGRWDLFEGQFFSEWDPKVHVVRTFKPPEGVYKWKAFDWGRSAPFSVLWFFEWDGKVWVYREWYGGTEDGEGLKMDPDEVATGIVQREMEDDEKDVVGYADPSIWAKRESEKSIAETMNLILAGNRGILIPAANDRVQGCAEMHRRLRIDEETGEPGLYVMDCCRRLIETLPTLVCDPDNPEVYKKGGDDHSADALRYGLMARPMPRRVELEKPPVDSLASIIGLAKAQRRPLELDIALRGAGYVA